MPIGIAYSFGAPPTNDVSVWLISLFAASIGLPFVVLAASAPLLQGWFAASGHPDAGRVWAFGAYKQKLTDAVDFHNTAGASTTIRITSAERWERPLHLCTD